MKLLKEMGWGVMALFVGSLVTACASYYKVTDPVSGRTYYTQDVEHERGGAATFTDAGSSAKITIQNSEVKEITKDEFNVGRLAKETKPAPAAPAAPAPSAAPAPEENPAGAESSPAQPDKSAAPAEESK